MCFIPMPRARLPGSPANESFFGLRAGIFFHGCGGDRTPGRRGGGAIETTCTKTRAHCFIFPTRWVLSLAWAYNLSPQASPKSAQKLSQRWTQEEKREAPYFTPAPELATTG